MINMVLLITLIGMIIGVFISFLLGIYDARTAMLLMFMKIWFVCVYYVGCWIVNKHKDIV